MLLVDDMGWADIGYQSDDLQDATPTLDALAEKGLKLSSHYAQSLCTPLASTARDVH